MRINKSEEAGEGRVGEGREGRRRPAYRSKPAGLFGVRVCNSRPEINSIYLQVHPGLAEIAGVAERAEADGGVAPGRQAFAAVGARHLAAPVGRALLWKKTTINQAI